MRILQKIKEIDVKTSHFFPQFYHHRFFSGAMKFIAGIGDNDLACFNFTFKS